MDLHRIERGGIVLLGGVAVRDVVRDGGTGACAGGAGVGGGGAGAGRSRRRTQISTVRRKEVRGGG